MEYTFKMAHYGEDRELNLTEEESELTRILIDALNDSGVITQPIMVVRKSSSYATVVARGEYDFDLCRFKFTSRASWVSVPVSVSDRDVYKDDPLFSAQKKKSQYLWKATISTPDDVVGFVPIILNAYQETLT